MSVDINIYLYVPSPCNFFFASVDWCGASLVRGLVWSTLHKELSDTRRRRIKIALQKEATREVLEGGEALTD